MRVLVTVGATREAIDEVRFLTNLSTGKTGFALAAALAAEGHEVEVLRGEGAVPPGAAPYRIAEVFSSAADLKARLARRLAGGQIDAVVMAAAVADYRPDTATAGKLSSRPGRLTLELVRNEKILPQLKGLSPRPLIVVGFKLTVGADAAARESAVAAQFAAGGVDVVVHNDLHEIRQAPKHPFRIVTNAAEYTKSGLTPSSKGSGRFSYIFAPVSGVGALASRLSSTVLAASGGSEGSQAQQ